MLFKIGRLEEFPLGSATIVEVQNRSIGVLNVDGQLYAILNVCPHQQAPVCRGKVRGTMLPSDPGQLVYGLDSQVLVCPRHGWEFHLQTGKALFGITKSRLLTFPIRVVENDVFVEMKERRGDPNDIAAPSDERGDAPGRLVNYTSEQ